MSKSSNSRKSKLTYTVGIDLGGTKVATALVDSRAKVISESRLPTTPPWMKNQDPREATKTPKPHEVRAHIKYVVEAMAESVQEALRPLSEGKTKGELLGVGLASAGPMNLEKGTLEFPSNFLGWKKVPLVELLTDALRKKRIKTRVYFQNDAMAAALGEGWIGGAQTAQTYAMVTVGTGIGCGVILNGKPAQSRGMGSEWGHLLVNSSGLRSAPESFYERSVEGLASGTGLIRRAKSRGFKGESAADLATAAQGGDKLALEVFAEASEGLAALFYSLSLGFHPDVFVVSGGMLAIKDLFLPQAIDLYRESIRSKNPGFLAPVRVSKLGNRAGVIGAARLPLLD